MTGSPYGVAPGAPWQPPVGPPAGPPGPPKLSRALMIVPLAVALIAIAVAVGSWFRPVNEPMPSTSDSDASYTEEEIAQAKDTVCGAHDRVSRATDAAGSQTSDDQLTKFTIGVNIRATAALSADYLFRVLEENPSTPRALASSVHDLASTYQEMLLLQVSDGPKAELEAVYERINNLDPHIDEECS